MATAAQHQQVVSNEPDLPTIRTKPSAGDSFGGAGGSRVNYPSEATAQTVGNLALKPQADVLEFPKLRIVEPLPERKDDEPSRITKTAANGSSVLPEAIREKAQTSASVASDFLGNYQPDLDSFCDANLANGGEVVASPAVKAKPKRTSKPKAAKTESTKEDADWLANSFPAKVKGAAGRWAVINHGAGFEVYFRVDKRQNSGEPINLKFPRISREMFLTLKGMNDAERKATIEKYVRGSIVKAIAEGDDRARVVAGKLRAAS